MKDWHKTGLGCLAALGASYLVIQGADPATAPGTPQGFWCFMVSIFLLIGSMGFALATAVNLIDD